MYYQNEINQYLSTINTNIVSVGRSLHNSIRQGSINVNDKENLELLHIGRDLLSNQIAIEQKPTFFYKFRVLDPDGVTVDIDISTDGTVGNTMETIVMNANNDSLTKQQCAENLKRQFDDVGYDFSPLTILDLHTILINDSVYVYSYNSAFTSSAEVTISDLDALTATNYLDSTADLIDSLNNGGSIDSLIPNIIDICGEFKDRKDYTKNNKSPYTFKDVEILTDNSSSTSSSTSTASTSSHTQNTDTYLTKGTSTEVSASELRTHLDNNDIHLTEAQIQALIDTASSIGISDVVDDTTPQLGGNLDLNSNNITGSGNINITGTIDSSGNITIDNGGLSNNDLTLAGSTHFTLRSTAVDSFAIRDLSAGSNRFTINSSGNILVTGTVDGRDLATDGSKLDNIEANADVTDAVNIASSIQGVVDKPTPADTDYVPLVDSADTFSLKQLTWANIKSNLQTFFDLIYSTVTDAFSKGSDTSDDITEGSTNLFATEVNVRNQISGMTISTATVATGDKVLIQDLDDSDNLKTVTTQSIANLKVTELAEDASPMLNADLEMNNFGLDLGGGNTLSSTELGFLDGVTSDVQTQLNNKLEDIVDDTTPQLGGDLDTQANSITGNYATDARRAIITESTTSRTLALTDAGDFIETSNGSTVTITIPTNASVAFPIGTEIDFFQYGAGTLTIEGDTGVTLNGVSAGSTIVTDRYKGATIKKRATNEWVIVGAINTVS